MLIVYFENKCDSFIFLKYFFGEYFYGFSIWFLLLSFLGLILYFGFVCEKDKVIKRFIVRNIVE